MEPYHAGERVTLYAGDCLDVLRELDDASVDAVVCDPPYGLEFMGKEWDSFKTGRAAKYARGGDLNVAAMAAQSGKGGAGPSYVNRPAKRCANCGKQAWSGSPCKCAEPQWVMDNSPLHSFQQWCELWATECLRVLKPGGHVLAFGGTRTWHRLACAVEDAGFEIRDSIAWLYGSGFPKSLDVSKAIDKAAGAEREVIPATGSLHKNANLNDDGWSKIGDDNATMWSATPATDDARTWQGWGSALKPAFEPVVVARKPLVGTIAQNVLAHGTGALNIDACRVDGVTSDSRGTIRPAGQMFAPGGVRSDNGRPGLGAATSGNPAGRWPANVILDESQAAALDAMTGESASKRSTGRNGSDTAEATWGLNRADDQARGHTDSGGASRFFFTTRDDKPCSTHGVARCTICLPTVPIDDLPSRFTYTAKAPGSERVKLNGTAHPTVKPLDLMRWLVRLVTPPGGLVLDPFAGSGTTVEACLLEGFRCVAIEREPDYLPLIMQRINRRIDPVAAVRAAAEDVGLFDLLGEETA